MHQGALRAPKSQQARVVELAVDGKDDHPVDGTGAHQCLDGTLLFFLLTPTALQDKAQSVLAGPLLDRVQQLKTVGWTSVGDQERYPRSQAARARWMFSVIELRQSIQVRLYESPFAPD